MGRKSPAEVGSKRIATRRVGVEEFPPFGGLHLLGDPASCPPNRFRHVENVRFRGGEIGSRGGKTKLAEGIDTSSACIIGLNDFQTEPRKIYGSFRGCPGVDSSLGHSLNWLDHEQEALFSRGVYYNALTSGLVMGVFDGRLFLGTDDTLKRMALIIPDYGDEQSSISGVEQAEKIETFTGFVIKCLMEFDGKLFIGCDSGAGTSKIVTWDGLTLRNDVTAIDGPTTMCRWRDKLVIGLATGGLKVRALGDSPGTYTNVASTYIPRDMASYRDNLYFVTAAATGVTRILKYDGTSLTTDRTILNTEIWSLGVFNGNMYYGYKLTTNSHALIGRLTSAGTYTDAHKDLTTQFGTTGFGVQTPVALLPYRGSLACGFNHDIKGAIVALSPTTNTSGTYVSISPAYVLSWVGAIDRLLVM